MDGLLHLASRSDAGGSGRKEHAGYRRLNRSQFLPRFLNIPCNILRRFRFVMVLSATTTSPKESAIMRQLILSSLAAALLFASVTQSGSGRPRPTPNSGTDNPECLGAACGAPSEPAPPPPSN